MENKYQFYAISIFYTAIKLGIGKPFHEYRMATSQRAHDVYAREKRKMFVTACEDYFSSHSKEIETSAPDKFMILHEDQPNIIEKEYLEDLNLVLAILAKSSGQVYIPNREIDFSNINIEKDLLIKKEELDG